MKTNNENPDTVELQGSDILISTNVKQLKFTRKNARERLKIFSTNSKLPEIVLKTERKVVRAVNQRLDQLEKEGVKMDEPCLWEKGAHNNIDDNPISQKIKKRPSFKSNAWKSYSRGF